MTSTRELFWFHPRHFMNLFEITYIPYYRTLVNNLMRIELRQWNWNENTAIACVWYLIFGGFAWMKIIWLVKCKFKEPSPAISMRANTRNIPKNHMSCDTIWARFFLFHRVFSSIFFFYKCKLIFRTTPKWAIYKRWFFYAWNDSEMSNKRLKLFEHWKSHFRAVSDRFSDNWSDICYLLGFQTDNIYTIE